MKTTNMYDGRCIQGACLTACCKEMLFIDAKLFKCIYSTKWWYTHVTFRAWTWSDWWLYHSSLVACITASLYHQQKTYVPHYHTLNWKGMSGTLQHPFFASWIGRTTAAMTCQESERPIEICTAGFATIGATKTSRLLMEDQKREVAGGLYLKQMENCCLRDVYRIMNS